MKRIVILGAGAQGAPCAAILSRIRAVDEVVLADYNLELATKVADKINAGSGQSVKPVQPVQVDASDVNQLIQVFTGAEAVINLTNPLYNAQIMEACLAVKAHYVDTSIGETLDVDLSASDNVLRRLLRREKLKFQEEFESKGLTCLIGCGSTPGITNVLARSLCDQLDSVDAVKIRFARKSAVPEDPDAPWVPTWAPPRAFWGFCVKPYAYLNGQFAELPLFSGYEEYAFHEPVGVVPVTLHHHPEQFTIPYYMADKVPSCDFKFYIDRNIRTLMAHGFGDPKRTVRVGQVEVNPKDVLMQMVKATTDRFLEETEESASVPFTLYTGAAVEVSGKSGGKNITTKLTYSPVFCDTPEEKVALLRKFGATNIYVALPAIVGALMCARGQARPGVIGSECLDPTVFLDILNEIHPLRVYKTVLSTL